MSANHSTALPGATALPGDGPPSQEIVRRTEQAVSVMPLMSDGEIERTWRLAQGLAASRMFKDANQAEQAFAKILIGRDLGLSPTRSLMTIDLVKGNIQLRGVLLAAWVRQSENYDYQIVEMTHDHCIVQFLGFPSDEQQDGMVRFRGQWWEELNPVEEFTLEDAERAKLVKEDSNWDKYPKNMCFWRALSNGVKFHAPELFAGMPVYVQGEVPSDVNVTASSSDGDPRGIALPPEVEEILQRAKDVGHHGLADRATAEMAVDGQPAELIAEWVQNANRELHSFADASIADADVLPDIERNGGETEPEEDVRVGQIKWLRDEAKKHLSLSLQAGEDGDREQAVELENEARRLNESADALEAEVKGS